MTRSAGLPARLAGNGRRRAVPEAGAPFVWFMGTVSRSARNKGLSMNLGRSAGFPACGFTGLSSPVFLYRLQIRFMVPKYIQFWRSNLPMNRSAGIPARLVGNGRHRAVPEAGAPILRFMRAVGRSARNKGLSMNREAKLVSREPALTPTLSPGERETRLPRLGQKVLPDWHWFRGSMRGLFPGDSHAADSAGTILTLISDCLATGRSPG
jgi:hypothetical protein